jgi:hypothetical protein
MTEVRRNVVTGRVGPAREQQAVRGRFWSWDWNKLGNIEVSVMGFTRTLTVALVLVRAAAGQTPEEALRSTIAGVHYPVLAEQAYIQGDVHLGINSGVVTVLSGNPLLAQISVDNAKAFGSLFGEKSLDVTYHFVLIDAATNVPTSVTAKRGDAFERAILRMFGRKTEKVTVEYRCVEGVAPPNDLKIAGAVVEIWIHGKARCFETEAETLAAKY